MWLPYAQRSLHIGIKMCWASTSIECCETLGEGEGTKTSSTVIKTIKFSSVNASGKQAVWLDGRCELAKMGKIYLQYCGVALAPQAYRLPDSRCLWHTRIMYSAGHECVNLASPSSAHWIRYPLHSRPRVCESTNSEILEGGIYAAWNLLNCQIL
jgi:hypothetical protein